MMRVVILVLLNVFVMTINGQTKNLYDFKVKDIDGKEFDMATLKGKKVLIVNVASKCGLTPQYELLEAIYQQYGGGNFVIVCFPSDNFAGQEFDTNSEIKSFCTMNYGVTFPMMSKIDVKGNDQASIYQWLTQKTLNGKSDNEVQWNFQKYMIDEKGDFVDVVAPKELPNSEKIINWIKGK